MQEMVIAPAYQSQGLGKVLLRHVIALAERNRVNLALSAGKGEFLSIYNRSMVTC